MPTLLIYLFKVNIALILFCAGYYIIFRKLTFYTLNRVYLIIALLFSSIYPLVDFSTILPQYDVVQPLQITDAQLIYSISSYGRAEAFSSIESYWQSLLIIFWMGVTVMGIRLVLQFASLLKVHHRSVSQTIYNRQVRIIEYEASAFSFWQSIYINPTKYSEHEIESVVAHEDVHVKQWHTLDILLAEVSLVFYWFNPGIWLIKKAISENLEFITDREILKQGINAKNYQYSLLYASFNTSPNAVVNHFNISTIKKRIIMMNAKKSSVLNLTRYTLMMPAVAALLLVFETSKAELIKKGINRATEITRKTLNAAQNAVLDNKNIIELKPITTSDRPAGTELNVVRGTMPTIQPDMNVTDTPRVKNIPRKALILGTGADSAYYLLNGKPVTYEQSQNVDPNIIVSVTILKDASATSLFGDAASKGAVLITTKGKENSADVQRIMQELTAATTANKNDKSIFSSGSASISVKMDSTSLPNTEISKRIHIVIPKVSERKNKDVTVRGYASLQKNITIRPGISLKDTVIQGHFLEKKKQDWVKTIFIIDNKEATKEEFDALDPKNIESINVIKDAQTRESKIKITTKGAIKPTSKS